MIYQLSVPAAVPGVSEIRILEWQGQPGAVFAPGDLIVELETHKAVIEIRAGQAGVLRQISAAPGDWRNVGVSLAVFSDQADEDILSVAAATDLVVAFEVV